jgi:hypothetical protein
MTYDRYMIGYKSVEVSGVKSAIKELRKIDPELRKQFNKDAKAVVKPVVDEAKGSYPDVVLSGMSRAWTQNGVQKFPYSARKARSGVKLKVDTRGKAVSIINVATEQPGRRAIIDMAGKRGGTDSRRGRECLVQNLTEKAGRPSRVMWPVIMRAHETRSHRRNGAT